MPCNNYPMSVGHEKGRVEDVSVSAAPSAAAKPPTLGSGYAGDNFAVGSHRVEGVSFDLVEAGTAEDRVRLHVELRGVRAVARHRDDR